MTTNNQQSYEEDYGQEEEEEEVEQLHKARVKAAMLPMGGPASRRVKREVQGGALAKCKSSQESSLPPSLPSTPQSTCSIVTGVSNVHVGCWSFYIYCLYINSISMIAF